MKFIQLHQVLQGQEFVIWLNSMFIIQFWQQNELTAIEKVSQDEPTIMVREFAEHIARELSS
jgi:hypothetical protein